MAPECLPWSLCFDWPVIYLDREGLGVLVLTVEDYKCGVLSILYNMDLRDHVNIDDKEIPDTDVGNDNDKRNIVIT